MDMLGRTHIDLPNLLDMRHYLQRIELFSSPLQRSTLLGLHRSRLRVVNLALISLVVH